MLQQDKPTLVGQKNHQKLLKQVIKRVKQSYYQTEILKQKNNYQKQWAIINELLSCKKKPKNQIHEIIHHCYDQKLRDGDAIYNCLNQFFTNIGVNMGYNCQVI